MIPQLATGADQLLIDQQAEISRYHRTLRAIQLGTTDQMIRRMMDLEDQIASLQTRLTAQSQQHETDMQAMARMLADSEAQLITAEHQHAVMEARAEKAEQRCNALFFLKERWEKAAFADELVEMIQGCNWLVDALQEAEANAYDFADAAVQVVYAFEQTRSLILAIAAADGAGFGLDSDLRARVQALAATLQQSAMSAKQE